MRLHFLLAFGLLDLALCSAAIAKDDNVAIVGAAGLPKWAGDRAREAGCDPAASALPRTLAADDCLGGHVRPV